MKTHVRNLLILNRPAQASQPTNGPQLAGFAAQTTAATDDVGLSLAVQVRGGGVQ